MCFLPTQLRWARLCADLRNGRGGLDDISQGLEESSEWSGLVLLLLPSVKLTWLAGKWTQLEDVFPIENGDTSTIAM